jgi:alpha-tubulin suppressor-like RCC1 family protein
VGGLSHAVAVAAGVDFSLGLLSNGTVWSWGEDQFGQLGTGSVLGPSTCDGMPCSPTPVIVSGLANVIAIAAGGSHALALLNNGTVMAWGLNSDGQLGDGTSTGPTIFCVNHAPCSPTPIPVTTPNRTPLSNVEAIAAGDAFSLALVRFTAGVTHVDAWGYNGFGQLGTGSTTGPITCANGDPCATYPGLVSGLSGTETAIAASGNAAQALALEADGSVAAWGDNEYGQAGSACGNPFCPSPMLVPGVSGATAISTSGGRNSFRSMALESGGQVAEWGTGPLGDGSLGNNPTPITVSSLSAPTAIAAGGEQSLAIALPPSNRFSIARLKCMFCLPQLKVTLPYPGVLTVGHPPTPNPGPLAASASNQKSATLVKPVTITVAQAGTVELKLKLTARGKRALRRKHELRVKVPIAFTPNGGTPTSQTITVTFRTR